MKRGSSLGCIEWPIPDSSALVLSGAMGALLLLGGRVLGRLDDVQVAGAAAEIAGDGLADLRLAGIRVARQQRAAGDHHPRRAVATLEAVLLPETFLDGMELAVLLQALHRRDLAAIGLHRQHR